MATESIDIRIREDGSRVVRRSIEDVGDSGRKAASGIDLLKRALTTISAGVVVHELIRIADTYTNIENRLRTVTSSTAQLTAVNRELLAISNQTRQSYEGTVEVYTRLAGATKQLGLTQQELLEFQLQLNQAVAMSGAGAQEAKAALIQLSQGLGAGALRGEELNSVLEQLPTVADIIAKQMGVTRGQLKGLAEDGKITADVVINAFKKAAPELQNNFDKSISTISQAFTVLQNQVTAITGEFLNTQGVASGLANSLLSISQNIEPIARAIGALAVIIGSQFIAKTVAAVAAQNALAIAVLRGNASYVDGVAAIRGRAAASLEAAKADQLATASTAAKLAADKQAIAASLARAQAERAQAVAQVELAAGIMTATGRTQAYEKAVSARNDSTRTVIALTRLERDLTAQLAIANQASAAATAQVTTAQSAYNAALASTTLASRAATMAMNGLRSAMAFFGGPVGLIFTALAAGTYFLATSQSKAEEAARLHSDAMMDFNKVIDMSTGKVKNLSAELISLRRVQLEAARDAEMAVIAQQEIYARAGNFKIDKLAFDLVDTGMSKGEVQALLSPVRELQQQFLDNKISAAQLFTEIEKLAQSAPTLKPLVAVMSEWAAPLIAAQQNLEKTNAGLAALAGNATDAQKKLLGIGETMGPKVDMNPNGPKRAEKIAEVNRQLDAQLKLMGKFGPEYAIQENYDRIISQLQSSKITLTKAESSALLEKLTILEKQSVVQAQINRIYQESIGPQEEYAAAIAAANHMLSAGAISTDQHGQQIVKAVEAYRSASDPLHEINRELQQQEALYGMLGPRHQVAQQLQQIENDLLSKGVVLNQQQAEAMRDRLLAMQQTAAVAQELNSIYNQTSGSLEQIGYKLQALNIAHQQGLISNDTYSASLGRMNVEMAQTRLLMPDASMADVATASIGQIVEGYEGLLPGLSSAFGDFFQSFTDGFANSVGRAIVYSEDLGSALQNVAQTILSSLISALIKLGIQYVMNAVLGQSIATAATASNAALAGATAAAWAPAAALASLATFGANAAPAAAAVTSTMSLTQGLALTSFLGFEEGGYTGDIGRKQVAGVVHGQEFVVNAAATARNRDTLEAMNRGAVISSAGTWSKGEGSEGGTVLNVIVENYSSAQIDVERLSESEVRIIAREEAQQVVRKEAPEVVASTVANPNSTMSKSLDRYTNANRKR